MVIPFVPTVGDFLVYVSAVFYAFACYLIWCVFLGPLTSLVRVSVGWLVFLPRSGIALPQSRLFHLGVSVPRAHGSLTVCSVALREIEEAMRPWLGVTSPHFLPTVSGWITRDTTVMVTLGHMRLHAPSYWRSSGLCSYGAVLGAWLYLMIALSDVPAWSLCTPHSFVSACLSHVNVSIKMDLRGVRVQATWVRMPMEGLEVAQATVHAESASGPLWALSYGADRTIAENHKDHTLSVRRCHWDGGACSYSELRPLRVLRG